MTDSEFVMWLRGFAELNAELARPTPEQWAEIKRQLNEVRMASISELHIETGGDAGGLRKAITEGHFFPRGIMM